MEWHYSNGVASGPEDIAAIAARIASREIGRDTLVWHDGMVDWQPAGSCAELTQYFAARPVPQPPPLPTRAAGKPPAPDGTQVWQQERNALPRSTEATATPGAGPLDLAAPPIFEKTGIFSRAAALRRRFAPRRPAVGDPPRLSRRFAARLIDMALVGLPIWFTFAPSLPHVSQGLAHFYRHFGGLILTAEIFPVVLINSLLLWLLGDSIGKSFMGIRAVPLTGGQRFTLRQALSRELRIFCFGLGAGIVPLAILGLLWQFGWRGASGGTARYDIGRASVITDREPTKPELGNTISLIVATLCGLIIVGLSLHLGHTIWTNPATQRSVTLPTDWDYLDAVRMPNLNAYVFANDPDRVAAYLILKPDSDPAAEAIVQLNDFRRSIAAFETLGDWAASPSDPDTWIARGKLLAEGWDEIYYARRIGPRFWFIRYVDRVARAYPTTPDPALVDALFGTASRAS